MAQLAGYELDANADGATATKQKRRYHEEEAQEILEAREILGAEETREVRGGEETEEAREIPGVEEAQGARETEETDQIRVITFRVR